MSASTVLVLFIVGIAVSIALGNKLKVNIGLIAMLYSFIMGVFFMGLKASDLTAMWPTKVFFTIMSITLFFGFATENGALGQFALKVITRHVPWGTIIMLGGIVILPVLIKGRKGVCDGK